MKIDVKFLININDELTLQKLLKEAQTCIDVLDNIMDSYKDYINMINKRLIELKNINQTNLFQDEKKTNYRKVKCS